MDTIIHSDTLAVARRLSEMGLSYGVLANAVTAGYQAASNCTELDPKSYRGLTMWAVTTRHLRMQLLPRWQRQDDGNFSLTVSPDGQMAIAVATGDIATGVTDLVPTTQSSKGPCTVEAVAANNRQLGFEFTYPDGWTPPSPSPLECGDRATWLLLIHRGDTILRAELSHPLAFDDNTRVCGWRERILLRPIETGPLDQLELADPVPPVEVPIHRRA